MLHEQQDAIVALHTADVRLLHHEEAYAPGTSRDGDHRTGTQGAPPSRETTNLGKQAAADGMGGMYYPQAMPCRRAKAVAAARLSVPVFWKMRLRWLMTVRSLRTRVSAISRLVLP